MSTKRKSSKKTLADVENLSNGSSEILVLPPDLLQKLGIDLKKLPQAQDCLEDDGQDTNHYVEELPQPNSTIHNDSPHVSSRVDKSSESSMIETANLMKESVFLSPTFFTVPNCTVTVIDEMDKDCMNGLSTDNNSKDSINGNVLIMPQDTASNENESPNKSYNRIQEVLNNDVIKECTIGNNSFKITNANIAQNSTGKEIIDTNIIVSDNSTFENPSSKSIPIPIETYDNIIVYNALHNNKDNLLDQTKINPNDLNMGDSLQIESMDIDFIDNSQNNTNREHANISHTQINSVLKNHILGKTSNNSLNNDINIHNIETTTINVTPAMAPSKLESKHKESDSIDYCDKIKQKLEKQSTQAKIGTYHSSKTIISNSNENINNNVNELNANEELECNKSPIKSILELCIIKKRKPSIPINTLKECDKIVNGTNEGISKDPENPKAKHSREVEGTKITFNSKHDITPRKLSIHGVEKPGGIPNKINTTKSLTIDPNNLKTYRGCAKKREIKNITVAKDSVNFKTVNIDLPAVAAFSLKEQNFCNCFDFGNPYIVKDQPSTYRHIHMLNNKPANCNIEDLFDDEAAHSSKNEIFDNNPDDNLSENIEICWKSMEYEILQCKNNTEAKTAKTTEDIKNDNPVKAAKSTEVIKNDTSLEAVKSNEIISTDEMETITLVVVENDSPKSEQSLKNEISTKSKSNKIKQEEFIKQEETPKLRTRKRKRYISSDSDSSEDYPLSKIKKDHDDNKNDDNENDDENNDNDDIVNNDNDNDDIVDNDNDNDDIVDDNVVCGVCNQTVRNWEKHIKTEHNYIAWIQGEEAINPNDPEEIKLHLLKISKLYGGLACHLCNTVRKYPKVYLQHMRECQGEDSYIPSIDTIVVKKSTKTCVCGVCNKEVLVSDWISHIQIDHQYLAWKRNETPVDTEDAEAVQFFLQHLSKKIGGMECPKCGIKRTYVKSYNQHIASCGMARKLTLVKLESVKKELNDSVDDVERVLVRCGVCGENIWNTEWLEHSRVKHQYLAWIEGETPIKIEDKEEVHQHMYDLIKKHGGLSCHKCGMLRKYIVPYLQHVEFCKGDTEPAIVDENPLDDDDDDDTELTCGACQNTVKSGDWIEHIQREHNYLGWRVGKDVLDVNDEDSVLKHLTKLSSKTDGFVCGSCGLRRKNVASFYKHTKICLGQSQPFEPDSSFIHNIHVQESVKCAICSNTMRGQEWINHSINYHYNLAWVEGCRPIDLRNPYEVEKYLKVYKTKMNNKLICKYCRCTRASSLGFYAHIAVCNKTEEEIESLKETCEKCQSKYLVIYKQQHMRAHSQQLSKVEANVVTVPEIEPVLVREGGRQAANRALAVINNYKAQQEGLYSCDSCSFSTDNQKTLRRHLERCEGDYSTNQSSDQDTDSSGDEGVDENEEEDENKKPNESSYVKSQIKLPFRIKNYSNYIKQSCKDICSANFNQKDLFPDWVKCDFDILTRENSAIYLPKLHESCKLQIHKSSWSTFQLFEAKFSRNLYSVFFGSLPTSIAWAPPIDYLLASDEPQYLAIACHNEVPSSLYNETCNGPNLIQIWNFGTFQPSKLPTLAYGIAHDFGIIWGMTWCPSGSRDSEEGPRLGILAIACSNGRVYILSLPNPINISEQSILKIKPVAELRLYVNKEATSYQPTCLDWSKKSGHSVILVGYSNGMVANFNLTSKSPILRTEEDGVAILFPYHDEQAFKGPLISLSTYAGTTGSTEELFGACSGTGLRLANRNGVANSIQWESMCASGGVMYQHWPSYIVSSDDAYNIQKVHELEVMGDSRRLTASYRVQTCIHCGEMASLTTPHIRIMECPHPAKTEIKRRVKLIVEMASLKEEGPHAKKKLLDDLVVKIEPRTYETAIKKYGLKVYYPKPDTVLKLDDAPAERYSLADISSTAFCLSPRFHKQIAFVTQAGMLFVMPLTYDY